MLDLILHCTMGIFKENFKRGYLDNMPSNFCPFLSIFFSFGKCAKKCSWKSSKFTQGHICTWWKTFEVYLVCASCSQRFVNKNKIKAAIVTWLVKLLPLTPASDMGTGSCPCHCTSNPAPCYPSGRHG